MGIRWLVGVAVGSLVLAAPAWARIDQPPAGQIALLTSAPASVELDQLQSDTTMFAFNERRRVTLPSDIPVDITAPGAYTSAAQLTPGVVPGGLTVDSAFVHMDTVTTRSTENGIVFDGSIHLDGPALGIAIEQGPLDASDFLAPLTTSEPTGLLRRRTNLDRQDAVTLSADRQTITIHGLIADKLDQLRVVSISPARADCANPTITGGPGNEQTIGTEGDDVIVDLEGNNTIDGLGGDDVICTGPGQDDIDAGPGNDVVVARDGNDQVDGGDGNDVIVVSGGNDTVFAGEGNNFVLGAAGTDGITGGSGYDLFDGGSGHDTCTGDGGTNVLLQCEVTD